MFTIYFLLHGIPQSVEFDERDIAFIFSKGLIAKGIGHSVEIDLGVHIEVHDYTLSGGWHSFLDSVSA